MAYVSKDEVRDELQQLVDPDIVTDEDLDRWIADAGKWIDARLGRRYAVPLTTPLTGVSGLIGVVARDFVVSRALRKHFSDRMLGEQTAWSNYYRSAEDELTIIVQRDLLAGSVARPSKLSGAHLQVIQTSINVGDVARLDRIMAEIDYTTGATITDEQESILEQGRP